MQQRQISPDIRTLQFHNHQQQQQQQNLQIQRKLNDYEQYYQSPQQQQAPPQQNMKILSLQVTVYSITIMDMEKAQKTKPYLVLSTTTQSKQTKKSSFGSNNNQAVINQILNFKYLEENRLKIELFDKTFFLLSDTLIGKCYIFMNDPQIFNRTKRVNLLDQQGNVDAFVVVKLKPVVVQQGGLQSQRIGRQDFIGSDQDMNSPPSSQRQIQYRFHTEYSNDHPHTQPPKSNPHQYFQSPSQQLSTQSNQSQNSTNQIMDDEIKQRLFVVEKQQQELLKRFGNTPNPQFQFGHSPPQFGSGGGGLTNQSSEQNSVSLENSGLMMNMPQKSQNQQQKLQKSQKAQNTDRLEVVNHILSQEPMNEYFNSKQSYNNDSSQNTVVGGGYGQGKDLVMVVSKQGQQYSQQQDTTTIDTINIDDIEKTKLYLQNERLKLKNQETRVSKLHLKLQNRKQQIHLKQKLVNQKQKDLRLRKKKTQQLQQEILNEMDKLHKKKTLLSKQKQRLIYEKQIKTQEKLMNENLLMILKTKLKDLLQKGEEQFKRQKKLEQQMGQEQEYDVQDIKRQFKEIIEQRSGRLDREDKSRKDLQATLQNKKKLSKPRSNSCKKLRFNNFSYENHDENTLKKIKNLRFEVNDFQEELQQLIQMEQTLSEKYIKMVYMLNSQQKQSQNLQNLMQ